MRGKRAVDAGVAVEESVVVIAECEWSQSRFTTREGKCMYVGSS